MISNGTTKHMKALISFSYHGQQIEYINGTIVFAKWIIF